MFGYVLQFTMGEVRIHLFVKSVLNHFLIKLFLIRYVKKEIEIIRVFYCSIYYF